MSRYRKPTQHERLRSAETELMGVYRDAKAHGLSSEQIGAHVRDVKAKYADLPRYMRSRIEGFAWALREVMWADCLVSRFTLHGETIPEPTSANGWLHLCDPDRVTLTVWKHAPDRVYLDHGSRNNPLVFGA